MRTTILTLTAITLAISTVLVLARPSQGEGFDGTFVCGRDIVRTEKIVELPRDARFQRLSKDPTKTTTIVLNAGPILAANPEALATWNDAIALWESILGDDVVVTIDAELAPLPQGVLGSTSSSIWSAGYDFVRDAVVADRAVDEVIAASLPTGAQVSVDLPSDPAGFTYSGSLRATRAALSALGFDMNGTIDPGNPDATITFSTGFLPSFDFDPRDGIQAGAIDFFAVVVHEMGHALGFISTVDLVDYYVSQGSSLSTGPSVLDLYRLEPGAGFTDFTAATRIVNHGGEVPVQVFFEGADELRMSTGRYNGDGNQASHWRADELSGVNIGIMDPSLSSGVMGKMTVADQRAFGLIGWDINPLTDCNENGIADQFDVWDGTSADINGNGVPDECEGVCPDPLEVTLLSPEDLEFCAVSPNVFFWEAQAGVDSYQVYITPADDLGAGTTYTTEYFFLSLPLEPDEYAWRVRGKTICGDLGPWSPYWSFRIPGEVLDVPFGFYPSSGATCWPYENITLNWGTVPEATLYELDLWSVSDTLQVTVPPPPYEYLDVSPDTQYFWRVRGTNGCGQYGPWSSVDSFRTKPAVPVAAVLESPPDGATVETGAVQFDWTHVPEAVECDLLISTTLCGPPDTTVTCDGDSTVIVELDVPGTFYWRVRTGNGCDESSFSECRGFEVAAPPAFVEVPDAGVPAPQWETSDAAWADYDLDGDFDVVVDLQLYTNDNGAFNPSGDPLLAFDRNCVGIGDFDRDGDPDLAVFTWTSSAPVSARVFRNDGGTFVDTGLSLEAVSGGRCAWGDYDNDGLADLAVIGTDSEGNAIARLYHNDGESLSDAGVLDQITGTNDDAVGVVSWVDLDDDGDLDLLLSGLLPTSMPVTRLFENTGGTFASGIDMIAGMFHSVDWGDHDADGVLELLVTMTDVDCCGEWHLRVLRNLGTAFQVELEPDPDLRGDAVWADFDLDGALDIAVSGPTYSSFFHGGLLQNVGDGSAYTLLQPLPGIQGPLEAVDFDLDGDLDVFQSGWRYDPEVMGEGATIFQRNDLGGSLAPPAPPTDLSATPGVNEVALSWSPSAVPKLTEASYTYNLRVGTAPDLQDVVSALADPATGRRHVFAMGNAGRSNTWHVMLPGPGKYYWSVQALDINHAGGGFAVEDSFTVVSGTGIDGIPQLSGRTRLLAAVPNPFNPRTRLRFELGEPGYATLRVYDVSGRLVTTLVDEHLRSGLHEIAWHGTDSGGRSVASGVYLYELRAVGFRDTKRMVLVR